MAELHVPQPLRLNGGAGGYSSLTGSGPIGQFYFQSGKLVALDPAGTSNNYRTLIGSVLGSTGCSTYGALGFTQGSSSNKCARYDTFQIQSNTENSQLGAKMVFNYEGGFYACTASKDVSQSFCQCGSVIFNEFSGLVQNKSCRWALWLLAHWFIYSSSCSVIDWSLIGLGLFLYNYLLETSPNLNILIYYRFSDVAGFRLSALGLIWAFVSSRVWNVPCASWPHCTTFFRWISRSPNHLHTTQSPSPIRALSPIPHYRFLCTQIPIPQIAFDDNSGTLPMLPVLTSRGTSL